MENVTYAVIFDMNKLCVEREEELNWEFIFKNELVCFDTNKKNSTFRGKGLTMTNKVEFFITDMRNFVKQVLNILYEGYEIIDCQYSREGAGHPDFILKKEEEAIYLELKISEDTLRDSQLRWFCNNKNKTNKILWLYPNIYYSDECLKKFNKSDIIL
jgi:hypothetical protein